ncbi:hypothetical protein GCM10009619_42280 [Williamsia maris]
MTVAASALDGKVDEFDKAMNSLIRDVDATMDSWKGDSATASQAAADSEKQISSRLGMGILQITDALNSLGPAFTHACDTTVRAADEFGALGYVVAANGMVTPPAGVTGGFPSDISVGLTAEEAAPVAANNARFHQAELARLLAAVGQADAALAAKVAEAANALGQSADRATASVPVSPQVQAILDGKAELPTDPEKLNAFWNTLTANEKAELWNHDRNVGNMDGIPAADRDHFNRRNLPDLQEKAQERLDKVGPEPVWRPSPGFPRKEDYPKYIEWKKAHDAAQRQVDGLKTLDGRLNNPSDRPFYLLAVRDNGQAAVAVNNPDISKNVSTFVPGTGTGINTLDGNLLRANAMAGAATEAGQGASASVITWQDYDAPQDVLKNAWQPHYAENAAGTLDRFQDGIAATHTGDTPAHTSVLGHSYGTTVVGQAALDGHTLNTNEVVLVASPGLGEFGDASELSLTGVPNADNGEHVWATVADSDSIKYTPGVILGDKPWLPQYGGQLFASDPSGGHSDYWNDDNVALENMGRIIAGLDTVDR